MSAVAALLVGLALLVVAVIVFDRNEWVAFGLLMVVAAIVVWGLL